MLLGENWCWSLLGPKGLKVFGDVFSNSPCEQSLPLSESHKAFNILSPDIHLQILQTDLQTFC